MTDSKSHTTVKRSEVTIHILIWLSECVDRISGTISRCLTDFFDKEVRQLDSVII